MADDEGVSDGPLATAIRVRPSSTIHHPPTAIGAADGATRLSPDRRQAQDVPGGNSPGAAVGQEEERPAAKVEVVEATFEPARAGLEADQAAQVLAPLPPGAIERLRAQRSPPFVPGVEAADQRAG